MPAALDAMSAFRGGEVFFPLVAAVLGAVVGSFLNACIHRLPRGLGLLNPRRSFCPGCGRTIPWWENLPIVSWVFLRARCSGCGWRISARYFMVEVLTAAVFVLAWWGFGWPEVLVWWVFSALLIAATFIDFEHMIIPDEITLGGMAAGVVATLFVPSILGVDVWWMAGLHSLGGALAGFTVLFLVVEGGKVVFGKKRHCFANPEPFEWRQEGDEVWVSLAGERFDWGEVFSRERDQLRISVDGAAMIDGRELEGAEFVFTHDRLMVDGEDITLSGVGRLEGLMRSVVIPREAMGFGDVKFLACIGAFVGWKGVLFTVFAGSLIGSLAGLVGICLRRDGSGARLPFGPFLALGGLVWVFAGHALLDWYFGLLSRGFGRLDF